MGDPRCSCVPTLGAHFAARRRTRGITSSRLRLGVRGGCNSSTETWSSFLPTTTLFRTGRSVITPRTKFPLDSLILSFVSRRVHRSPSASPSRSPQTLPPLLSTASLVLDHWAPRPICVQPQHLLHRMIPYPRTLLMSLFPPSMVPWASVGASPTQHPEG